MDIVLGKQVLNHLIVVAIDLGHIRKLLLAEFPQYIGLAYLARTSQNQGFAVHAIFPFPQVLYDVSIHLYRVSIVFTPLNYTFPTELTSKNHIFPTEQGFRRDMEKKRDAIP